MFNKILNSYLKNRSDLFRRSLKNAGWSTADYLVLPILMLATTPFLVNKLGVAQYGIWMLVNSVMGMMGVMNLGLGDATIKFVSYYRAKDDSPAVIRVIRSTLTIYLAMGILTAGLVYLLAPIMVNNIFKVESSMHTLAIQAIQIGGIVLAIKFIDSIFLATLRGFERYDLSRITIIIKALIIAFSVILAAMGNGIIQILLSSLMLTAFSALGQAWMAKRLVKNLHYNLIWDTEILREVFGFGIWSWLQGTMGILFSQADRFLISVILGTTSLTYYTISLQIAQQAHSLLASASSFIFPLSSVFHSNNGTAKLHAIYSKSMTLITMLATTIVIPIYLLAPTILTTWMGADFAEKGTVLLRLLVLAYGGMTLTIIPYYLLNGTGFIRMNVIFGTISSVMIAIIALILLPEMGIIGAGWAHLSNFIIIIIYIIFINRAIFKNNLWLSTLSYLASYIIPISFILVADRLIDVSHRDFYSSFLIVLLLMIVGVTTSYSISKMRQRSSIEK